MNVNLLVFPVLVLMFISCQHDSQNAVNNDLSISFSNFSYNTQTGDCTTENDPCFALSYIYPEMMTGPSELKDSFNALMVNYIQQQLKTYLSDSLQSGHTEEIIEKLFSEYNLLVEEAKKEPEEMGDLSLSAMYNWYVDIKSTIMYEAYPYISLSIMNSSHQGGAHPNTYEKYVNFKLPSLIPLSIDQVIKDVPAVTKLAENLFRTKYDIPEGESFSDHGYWFEEDVFILPENMALEASGILFMYNPYEIGPYVFGSLDVTVPYELLKPYLILDTSQPD
jgi:hypothetical protein